MSENSVNPVSAGSAPAVEPNPVRLGASGGKVGLDAGKMSPHRRAGVQAMKLDQLVKELNSKSRSLSPALRFQVDLQSGTSVIQVFDRDSGELIRQIPPEKASALVEGSSVIGQKGIDDLV